MEKVAYTHLNTDTTFYTLPEGCEEIIEVAGKTYDDSYKPLVWLGAYKSGKLIGFSLDTVFDEIVPNSLRITFKTL